MPLLFFFFSSRRRHTRFDCDWSSDVCSSDLQHFLLDVLLVNTCAGRDHAEQKVLSRLGELKVYKRRDTEIGRASCRERGEISVVAVSLKKKKKTQRASAHADTSRRTR